MQTLTLQREDWKNILDHVSRERAACTITIEIIRENLGGHMKIAGIAFGGLSYDTKSNAIAIRAGAVERMIAHPAGVKITYQGMSVACMEVVEIGGSRHVITFAAPLDLPDLLLSAYHSEEQDSAPGRGGP